MILSARYAAILRRFDAGETLEAIGADFGITRERVRQIAKAYGRAPRNDGIRERVKEVARYLDENWVTSTEAAEKFGVSPAAITHTARKHGIELPFLTFAEELEIKKAVALVRAGQSMNAVAKAIGRSHSWLQYHCRQRGVVSRGKSKWRDFSHRPAMLRQWREEGCTWAECSRRLGEHEGQEYHPMVAHNWAVRHAPELTNLPRVRKPAPEPKTKLAKRTKLTPPVSAPADIQVLPTVRETALANRGKASASVIAAALGVTRNSIIGHWFRARHSEAA